MPKRNRDAIYGDHKLWLLAHECISGLQNDPVSLAEAIAAHVPPARTDGYLPLAPEPLIVMVQHLAFLIGSESSRPHPWQEELVRTVTARISGRAAA